MQIIRAKEFHIDEPTAVAMGKFDSLHLGHKVILDRLKREAECSLRTVVLSFEPGPEVFFGKYSGGFVLTDTEKQKLLEDAGIDYYVLFPFDAMTAGTEPEDFLKNVLLAQMNMQVLVAGEDLSFGRGGYGNAEFVNEKSREYDFKFCVCPKIRLNEEEISATLVRDTVIKGDMEKCRELLGRAYQVGGIIQKGNQLGRTIGVPTCNIVTDREKLLPPRGVYFTEVTLGGQHYYGVTNVGTKPTVSNEENVGIETYIVDFDEEAYGENIVLDFMHFQRTEQKFASLDELKSQLKQDIKKAEEYFKNKFTL